MKRREFLAAIGGALAAPLARAQSLAPKRTLGILSLDPAPRADMIPLHYSSSKLRELGWYEGTNLVVERRFADGRAERLPEFAAELVGRRVDAIWATGSEAAVAAARATPTIPIVFWGVGWPVEQGLIDSLPRPGRNVTGLAWSTGNDVAFKNLEFLKEIAPEVRRIASIGFPLTAQTVTGGTFVPQIMAERDRAMRSMGYEYQHQFVQRSEDFEGAFAAIMNFGAKAVFVGAHFLTFRELPRILGFMNRNRLPSYSNAWEYAEGGGLFGYGPDIGAMVVYSLRYVDRILRGAKPADLPVELPSRYELAVNLKTAAHLGLKIPRTIIARADRLIE